MKCPPTSAGVALATAVSLIFSACSKSESPDKAKAGGPPPAPVLVAKVATKTMPRSVESFGTVEANFSVAIKPQVTGPIASIHFKRGQAVKQGDLLYKIDSRPIEATIRQLEANRAKDTAQFENAEKDAARQTELRKKEFSSQEALDQAVAAVDALAAALQADEAAIDQAKIQLEYCSIRAPLDGRTGTAAADPGNVVKANETTLVTVLQVQPIKVNFTLSEKELPQVLAPMAAGKVTVTALTPSEPDKPETGELVAVDNAIDPGTGMVKLNALFPNASGRLWPGQFVNVSVSLGEQADAVVVPAQAVQTSQKGTFVFVVAADSTVAMRPVTVERTVGIETVIAKGLNADEQVVTDGHLRLRPGAKVVIREPGKPQPNGRQSK
jgi:multidrug efflux system membrane fusion protein